MDPELRARRAQWRVIISEAIMVLAVIATVAVLAFLVSGYWVNSDFKVERQGLLQISSIPTGADVEIDGNSGGFFGRTNTSKVLSSGEHTIKLTKEGYDSWSRTIDISEGLLYRVHYPRLFLENRDRSSVLTATTATFATVSPSRAQMLIGNNTTSWTLLSLERDKLDPRTVNLPANFPSTSRMSGDSASTAGIFTGEIIEFLVKTADHGCGSPFIRCSFALSPAIDSARFTPDLTLHFPDRCFRKVSLTIHSPESQKLPGFILRL